MDARTICIHFFCVLIFFIYLCIMKEGRAIRDKQIKAIKTIFKDTCIDMKSMAENGYEELTNAIIKIINIRKYENTYGNDYTYEVDVILDMGNWSYFYSNKYCEKYKVRCNGYYRRKVAKILEHELKYFGFDIYADELVVKKITYKEIV